nr:hypothetical protein [Chloroflexota bacterium]
GLAALAERLRVSAPILAGATDLANPRRVVRALEIAALRGDGPRPALRERFDPALPAFSAIGYREAWAVADGRQSREAAIAADAARNVAFARRQKTWFRSEPGVTWLDVTTDDPAPAARAMIGELLG